MDVEADVSFSYKPDKYKTTMAVGWATPDKFELKQSASRDGQKLREWDFSFDKNTLGAQGKVVLKNPDRQAEFKIDNIKDPRTMQWGARVGPKSYKISAVRVPRESLTIKLDQAENTILKEVGHQQNMCKGAS